MDADHRLRANRVAVSRECVMVDEFDEERPARIIDISKNGFRLRASDCPDAGDLFRLLVDGYEFRCQVIWTHYGEIGGTFLEYIELDNQGSAIMTNQQDAEADRRSNERRSNADRRQIELPCDHLPVPDRRVSDRRGSARREAN